MAKESDTPVGSCPEVNLMETPEVDLVNEQFRKTYVLSWIAPGNGGNGTYLDSLLQALSLMKDTKDENSHPAAQAMPAPTGMPIRRQAEDGGWSRNIETGEGPVYSGIAAIASLYYLILLMSSIYIVCNNI